MTNTSHKDPLDRLTAAYDKMLQEVHEAAESAKENALPGLKEYLDDAREKLIELGELSREEAEKVAGYVERDMKDAANYLLETGEQLSAWWRFDVQQVENRMLEMFTSVADQTKLELAKLAQRANKSSLYHTGEVTGPGSLLCIQCGKEMHFKKTGHIPPCSGCKGTEFQRAVQ
ncbi:MAG: zinc ribbon-containing protein [Candidatus Thiodiazotropha sp.]|nr:zinc ribbon-containing protein [Candidatus Thiodiazotropha sp.]MCU7802111.1 zinc ribbon-containing protein [Candidatus Thiodiazotropha sp. (ex Lucinoma borealis)]MCU7838318.1 zinc ribbon-containing protein [Candidatus Thiodiazotropha sp. (ex Troendleina suluensis)]MCU7886017.1 zinc ribbon-containing protein [Candidatus Thiodiazotropha sp. (ex Lucinoma annulata)]MCU7945292.1 zinc ribbon-containing protein [Candidatus Thiodiazotropha sp. (ex Cardiolucina cf. quadrata)]